MALQMTDEQRLKLLEDYNPKEHLISVGKNRSGQSVQYYPAAWRLYELTLRCPQANLESEIHTLDLATNFVIVSASVFWGVDYATSTKKARAFKQGKLSELDKVETAAKARAVRDFGIGTEYVLDIEEGEEEPEEGASPRSPQRPSPARPSVAPKGEAGTTTQKEEMVSPELVKKIYEIAGLYPTISYQFLRNRLGESFQSRKVPEYTMAQAEKVYQILSACRPFHELGLALDEMLQILKKEFQVDHPLDFFASEDGEVKRQTYLETLKNLYQQYPDRRKKLSSEARARHHVLLTTWEMEPLTSS